MCDKTEIVYQAALEILEAQDDKDGCDKLHKMVEEMDADNIHWREKCNQILSFVKDRWRRK